MATPSIADSTLCKQNFIGAPSGRRENRGMKPMKTLGTTAVAALGLATRGVCGGSCCGNSNSLHTRAANADLPSLEADLYGFCAASVPEPSPVGLLALLGAGWLAWKRRRVSSSLAGRACRPGLHLRGGLHFFHRLFFSKNPFRRSLTHHAIIPLVFLFCGAAAQRVEAQSRSPYLVNSGSWDVASNWSNGWLPRTNDTANIGDNLTATLATGVSGNAYILGVGPDYNKTGTLNITGGNLTTYATTETASATVGGNSGSVGILNISSGTFTNAHILAVGFSGTGTLNITGGAVISQYANLGWLSGSNGTVNISSGWFIITGQDLRIGLGGTGALNMTGGTVLVGAGGSGVVNLDGRGTLNIGTGGAGWGNLAAASVTGSSTDVTSVRF